MAKYPDKITIELNCITESSNKFYNLELTRNHSMSNWELHSYYGKIGKKGSHRKIGNYSNWIAAEIEMRRIARQKLSKGYKTVDNTVILSVEAERRRKKDKSLQRFSDILE